MATSDTTHTLVRLLPGRERLIETITPDEERIVKKQQKYLEALCSEGILIHAGRTTDSARLWAVVIMKGSEERAAALMQQDPAVRAGLQTFETFPYMIVVERDRPIRF